MADPYKPEPRPIGPNRPDHPHYRRDNHKKLAKYEVSPILFLGRGEEFPDGSGTHVYGIGDGGSVVGFYASVFGSLTPDTLGGSQIEFLQVNSAGTFQLGTLGDAQIGTNAYVAVEVAPDTGEADGVHLMWNPDFGDYRAGGRVDIWNFLSARKGTSIAIKMLTQQEAENPGGESLSDQVAAILAGTTGFALDPTDATTMWQDSAKTTPVTAASQPIGAMQSKWGTASWTFVSSLDTERPLWDGTGGMSFDGASKRLMASGTPLLRNVPASFVCARLAVAQIKDGVFWHFGAGNAANSVRNFAMSLAVGRTEFQAMTIDAGGATIAQVTGVVSAGPAFTLTGQANHATDRAMTLWLDGAVVATNTLANAAANTSDTNAVAASIGRGTTGWGAMNGKIGRMVCCPFVPTAEQRATIEAWVAETSLDVSGMLVVAPLPA